MDMLYRLMGNRAKRFTDSLAGLCGFIFAVLLTYQSFQSTVEMYRWNEGAEMIYAILIGGVMFSRLLVQTDVTPALVNYIASLQVSPYTVIFLFSIMTN
jgi:TRAP-type C4-dicarboxylate transport system permease small subunit